MQGLSSLAAFAETAKHGGFAAAARALGTDPSTVGKAVARLEQQLGVRLLHRTTRRMNLTHDGERLYERCRRVLEEFELLQEEAAGAAHELQGTLRVDLPITFGRRIVLPRLARLVERHPNLRLDVRLSDAYADLVRDRIDVALRIGTLEDSGLVARRVASQVLVACASPAYLRAHGAPRAVADLDRHRHVLFRMPGSGRDRPQEFWVAGRAVERRPADGQRFTDGEAMVQAAVLGLGIAQVPDHMVTDELRDGRLVEVLPTCRPKPLPIWAVMPAGRHVPARVQAFLECLADLEPAGVRARRGASPRRVSASCRSRRRAERAGRDPSLRSP